MMGLFKKLQRRIDGLSERERGILFVMITVIVLFVMKIAILDPQLKKQDAMKAQLQANQTQMAQLQSEMNMRMEKMGIDPDAEIKKRIANVKEHLQKIEKDLGGFQKNLVSPARVDAMLENILRHNKRLQLVSLKSLPVVNLMPVPNADEKAATTIEEQSIYKHEVELVLTGNYLDMLAYMRELEAMPERLYWGHSQLTVIEYPKAKLSLNLFTLSLEKKWLDL